MKFPIQMLAVCQVVFGVCCFSSVNSQTPDHPNIIMIYIDDLNDYVEYLGGHPQVETPHITTLAQSGVAFTNAFCSSPGCGPSRTSMLSGKDCLYTRVYNNEDYHGSFRQGFNAMYGNETVYSIPEILKSSNEYFTYSIGKIFHSESSNDFDTRPIPMCEKEKSWNRQSSYIETPEFTAIGTSYFQYAGYSWAMIPDSLESYIDDVQITDTAIQFISEVAAGTADICDKSFFLAFGIHKPHTPRLIPEKYFLPYYAKGLDHEIAFNTSTVDSGYNGVVMPPQPEELFGDFYALPENGIAQMLAYKGDQEEFFNAYLNGLPELPVLDPAASPEQNFELLMQNERAKYVLGYLAAVKFLDAQIGRLMDTLQQFPEIYNNTVIILVSDHGYSLSEKRHYTKWALWDTDVRVPMIFSGPGIFENGVVNTTVSQIDLMPTICDIAGVTIPDMPDGSRYEDGVSFKKLLENPNAFFNKPAICSYRKHGGEGSCYPHYSVYHDGYHYIRYHYNNEAGEVSPCEEGNTHYDEELYYIGVNRQVDPNEWNNLAGDPKNAPIIEYLSSFLPGNSNYLEESMKADILIQGSMPCYLSHTGKLKMKAKLYATSGELIPSALMGDYNFTWTNSATGLIKHGNKFTFKLSSIPMDYYTSNSSLRIYLKVTDQATGEIVAFKTIEVAINPDNVPAMDFTPDLNGLELSVNDVEVTGAYQSVQWDLGDGTTSTLFNPLTHIYSGAGDFPIVQTVNYGNGCVVQNQKTVYIRYVNDTFCEGASYVLPDGSVVETPGKYTVNLTSVAGTDSVVFVKLKYAGGCDEMRHHNPVPHGVGAYEAPADATLFNVYPNPVNNTLFVKRSTDIQLAAVQLYSIDGRLLGDFEMLPGDAVLEIPMRHYPGSVYLLKIVEQADVRIFRVVKSR